MNGATKELRAAITNAARLMAALLSPWLSGEAVVGTADITAGHLIVPVRVTPVGEVIWGFEDGRVIA
jgi:hypothetical protein